MHISTNSRLKENGMVPLRVQRTLVLSSLSQPCHRSLGLVPVQWRVYVDRLTAGMEGEGGYSTGSD